MTSSGVSDERAFYQEPASELRQGDLVRQVVWGVPSHDIVVCRPDDGSRPIGRCTCHLHHDARNPAAFARSSETIHARANRGIGIILWADCQLDYALNRKRENSKAVAAIAPVQPLSVLDEALWPKLVAGERPAAFFLPASPELESAGLGNDGAFADLRHIWSLKQQALAARVCSLTEPARRLLTDHIFWFLTAYRAPVMLTCPGCGTAFEPVGPFEYPAQEGP